MISLKTGDKAPSFRLLDQNENSVSLSDFEGKKLFVYFYPMANTPGCTLQSCTVSDALPELGKLDVATIGISPNKPTTQKKFDERFNLGFPLLSDVNKEVADKYGVLGSSGLLGVMKMVSRSAFLIDEKGHILEAWPKIKAKDTVPKALEALKQLR